MICKVMKKVFIGIDVSKKTIDASVIIPSLSDDQPIVLSYGKFDNRPSGFRKMIAMVRKISNGIDLSEWLFCCETTGAYDIQMCDYMVGKNLDIWREHASHIAKTRICHGKDDRKDSLLIAEYAWRNRDKARVYVPTPASIKDLRQLFLYRRQMVEMRKQLSTRMTDLKATIESDRIMSYIYRESQKQIDELSDRIKDCEQRMREIIEQDKDLSCSFGHIMSVVGIGLVSTVAIIIYTGNFKLIDSYKSFACYCGVVPFYEDSGTSVHKREYIGHKSNRMVRSYLIQAAHIAAMHNKDMVSYRERMTQRGKAMGVIINNIVNKLLRVVFSLIKNDCNFEENHEFKREEQIQKERMNTVNTVISASLA